MFAAELRLPTIVSRDMRSRIVEQTIEGEIMHIIHNEQPYLNSVVELGLQDAADTVVGGMLRKASKIRFL